MSHGPVSPYYEMAMALGYEVELRRVVRDLDVSVIFGDVVRRYLPIEPIWELRVYSETHSWEFKDTDLDTVKARALKAMLR